MDFPGELERALREFDQIRLGGELCEEALRLVTRIPSTLLTLKCADAFVNERGDWWLRNYLVAGLQEAIAAELKGLDFNGGVFVLGSAAEARASIAALVRVGFRRFLITDVDEERGERFVTEARSTYFKVQFDFVPRHMITQLPGVNSIAVNTIPGGRDQGMLAELFYFNFLKSGGVWLDLALSGVDPALEAEAKNAGALVEPGANPIARADVLWATACYGTRLKMPVEYESHLARLHRALERGRKA